MHNSKLSLVLCVLSCLTLAIFIVSRNLLFVPISSILPATTSLILASLNYINYLNFKLKKPSLYGLGLVLFTSLKYYIVSLLLLFDENEAFNDYAQAGFAMQFFLLSELASTLTVFHQMPILKASRLKFVTSILMAGFGFCASAYLLLLSFFNQPRSIELRYANYEPNIRQSIEIWYVDYGGSFYEPHGGVHCKHFTIARWGFLMQRTPMSNADILRLVDVVQQSCVT